MKYNHKKIEKHWQKIWEKEGIYRAEFPSKKKKYYILIEFPYPSGERLHVGHARSYSAMDAIARKRRMQGYNVLYPIGWDAFGLPAENFAIKTGIHPSITTKKNIENAKKQAKNWGLSFDWEREINTTDPKYYKWTQWIFLQLFKQRLAYRAEIPVNWCPSCKINLANEEVIKKSKVKSQKSKMTEEINVCERCGTGVTKRMQKQWMLKITEYAKRLLDDLEKVDYREDIKKQQVEWIGKSVGALVRFKIQDSRFTISAFTTRLDTLFGATALVVAPDKLIENKHLALEIAKKEQYQKVKKYIESTQSKSELERTELKEKTGVFTGAYAINPVNGAKIPIWVADYVVGWYGEGAIMLVPASDVRDFEFAKKYGIESRTVVKPADNKFAQKDPHVRAKLSNNKASSRVFTEDGVLVNSGKYTGLSSKEAREKMLADGKKQGWASEKTTYKLRDWVFSRQHYWGEPIPIIYCRKCWKVQGSRFKVQAREGVDYTIIEKQRWAILSVPEKDLPIELPHVKKYEPTETGESPLANVEEWVKTKCPKCGAVARRETDTMPNWAGSSWYYLAYPFWDNQGNPKSKIQNPKEKNVNENVFSKYSHQLRYWLPVDWYNGGLEHTTLHLLYSRFWHKFLFDLGVVPTAEPYAKRTSHGVVLGPDGTKMSKSRGNVINPDEVIEKYGADSFRVYEMFMGPFEEQVAWSDEALSGVRRFLDRIWRLYQEFSMTNFSSKQNSPPGIRRDRPPVSLDRKLSTDLPIPRSRLFGGGLASDIVSPEKLPSSNSPYEANDEDGLRRKLHQTIKKVSDDMEKLKFNTAIAALMEFINEVYKFQFKAQGSRLKVRNREIFLRLLAPFAPHLAEELYQNLLRTQNLEPRTQKFTSVHQQPWPKYDPKLVEEEMIEFVIQVNGKLRATLVVDSRQSTVESAMEKKARESERVQKYLEGKKIEKTIFVPGKLINFVT